MVISLKWSVVFISFLITVTSAQNNIKDVIGFPESEENNNLLNKQNRQPVFIPSMCPGNELFYPGDQEGDWICDCRPGHLYHPKTDFCWPAFRKGPCAVGQYLILTTKSVVPICVPNPCTDDNRVQWNGSCEVLGTHSPCKDVLPLSALWVNATTVTIGCIPYSPNRRYISEITALHSEIPCPPGCKRNLQNKCQ